MSLMILSPMLATDISKVDKRPDAFEHFTTDDRFAFEQKVDGRRSFVVVSDGKAHGTNRNGERKPLPPAIERVFAGIEGDWVFDGEILDGRFHLFDMPVGGMLMDPTSPYVERREILDRLFASWKPADVVRLLPWARTTDEKRTMAERLRSEGCEGVMIKRLDAPYQGGRRSTEWIKMKFTQDVDCWVTRVGTDGKANMTLSLWNGQKFVEVGECTALAGDGPRVHVGDVVSVKVLYATKDNRLYQPTLPRIRDDKRPEECTLDQLDDCRVNKEVLA